MDDRPRPLSLMFFMPSLAGGGAERVLIDYAREARNAGHDVHVVLVNAEGAFADALEPGVRLTDLGLSRARFAVWPLRRLLRRERPDALISQLRGANLAALTAAALAGTGARRIAIQGIALSRTPDRSATHLSFQRRLITAATYRLADTVVAPCRGVGDDLALWLRVPRERIAVTGNPVHVGAIRKAAQAPPPDPWTDAAAPLIVGAGRLVAQKNFAMLLDAFARVRSKRDARLIILGEGPQRPALEARAEALGIAADVRLPGFVPNPFAYFARAGAFALSSDLEAFGNVIVEALACGCPVVSTHCPWGPSEILEGGRFGRLVAVGDPDAMALALIETLDSPPARDALVDRANAFDSKAVFGKFMAATGLA